VIFKQQFFCSLFQKTSLSAATMSELKGDDTFVECPNLRLPQLLYVWEKNGAEAAKLEEITTIIEKNVMTPFYTDCCAKYGWTLDEIKLTSMR
jgi:hypothetical protein